MKPYTLHILCTLLAFCSAEDSFVTVETNVGSITGFAEDVNVFGDTYKVEKYLGIPYAEAPIGDRRFQKPVQKPPFSSPYNAVKYGNACFAMNFFPVSYTESEDCLFLNVFVPAGDENKRKEDLAVMVWIHGGGYINGASDIYAFEKLASFGNVVVVTLNYRLAVFGFYSTDDDSAPGNYGLWDQHLAIKWVHDNIEGFGGDPKRVTIFGESAGSASVIFQSLYEGNKGLFQRAIGQSGSITSAWASAQRSRESATTLGHLLGCNTSDTSVMTACIKYMSAERINSTINNFTNGFYFFPIPVGPVVDGEFIKDSPWDLLNSDTKVSSKDREFFSSLDLMIGVMEMDGLIFLGPLNGISDLETFEADTDHFTNTYVPQILSSMYKKIPKGLNNIVSSQYMKTDSSYDLSERRNQYVSFGTDVAFAVSTINTILLHAKLSSRNRYLYNFHPAPSHHILPVPSWVNAANHGDDLLFMGGFPESVTEGFISKTRNVTYEVADWEVILSKAMMTAWTNFAKTGNPNLPSSLKPYLQIDWPMYDLDSERYLNFTREMTSEAGIGDHLHSARMEFWLKTVPAIFKAEKGSLEGEGSCDKDGECPP